jgi:hypothetical protein
LEAIATSRSVKGRVDARLRSLAPAPADTDAPGTPSPAPRISRRTTSASAPKIIPPTMVSQIQIDICGRKAVQKKRPQWPIGGKSGRGLA